MLIVKNPGPQTTLQGAPRTGFRHYGIPYAGPADRLSLQLANRLVGNDLDTAALEIIYAGFEAVIQAECSIAVTGAFGGMTISGRSAPSHETIQLAAGDTIKLAPASQGVRTYLAAAGGFEARSIFGSASTYIPAGLGGHDGRALRSGDELRLSAPRTLKTILKTPEDHRPVISDTYTLRACASAETESLSPASKAALFETQFTIGRQSTRMGVLLEGAVLEAASDGLMKSSAVYPGTIQCPPSGAPVILLSDGQTTGGYPRVAHIARCDRHMLGQLRPGDRLRLLHRTYEDAAKDNSEKQAFLEGWLT